MLVSKSVEEAVAQSKRQSVAAAQEVAAAMAALDLGQDDAVDRLKTAVAVRGANLEAALGFRSSEIDSAMVEAMRAARSGRLDKMHR